MSFKVLTQLKLADISIPNVDSLNLVSYDNWGLDNNGSARQQRRATTKCTTLGRKTTFEHQIDIILGLSGLKCSSVLGHEYLHVRLNENSITMSDKLTEGFCNLGAAHVLKLSQDKTAPAHLKMLEEEPDQHCRYRYKIMKTELQKTGWAKLKESLMKYSKT